MVKLPKEVGRIVKTLEDNKFKAYAVGECVRDTLVGKRPYGWDVATSARPEQLFRLFPNAKIISEKYGVIRFEFIESVLDSDGIEREQGIIVDVASYRAEKALLAGGAEADAGAEEGAENGSCDEDDASRSEGGGNDGDNGAKDDAHSVVGYEGRTALSKKEKYQLTDKIDDDLKRRGFTVNAIADNSYSNIDPFSGIKDLRDRLVRTIGSPDELFKRDPMKMMTAARIVGDLGFDMQKDAFEAMEANYSLLEKVSMRKLGEEFKLLMSSENAGKALGILLDSGIIRVLLGERVFSSLTRRERSDLMILSQNIDRSKRVEDRRLGLFYACMEKKRALPAIEKLQYDEETHQHLTDAAKDMAKLYFATQPHRLKKFIYDRGWERYEFLVNMEKAQRIVFDYHSETKIRSKMYLVEQFKKNGEAIFSEDLKIDANDLVEAGICKAEESEALLGKVTERVHVKPKLNNRKDLLKIARMFKRSKILTALRGVKWAK